MSFDTVIDRRNTGSLKWARYEGRDVLPLWVADMDFAVADPIRDVIAEQLERGVLGYTRAWPGLNGTIVDAMQTRYDWLIQEDWIVWIPGCVPALNVFSAMSGDPGDGIVSLTPIYPPFLSAPGNFDRQLQKSPMRCGASGWEIDFDQLDDVCGGRSRSFMFCNPENPTGRAFTRAELERVAELCLRHDLLICSDEIHCDLILDDIPHIPIASLGDEIADRCITLMAPSKTYNVPGLSCAFAIISNPRLRRQFCRQSSGMMAEVSAPGYVACEAAYSMDDSWRQELLAYLRANRDLVAAAVAEMPGCEVTHVEATYLAWIDTRNCPAKHSWAFFERNGVGLSRGADFDDDNFVRLNFACPRSTLKEALARMKTALLKEHS
ncbi:MAG: cystathionine beta-lyase [Rhodothermales bacterium]|jgi:cystathionine beta-lyase